LIGAVLIGWVFFFYTDLGRAFQLLKIMFGLAGNGLADAFFYINFTNNAVFFITALIACTPIVKTIRNHIPEFPGKARMDFICQELVNPVVNLGILVVSTIFLVGKTYNPFLYFRF
jgi:alginate O-acetyltransferase complex protein AlgI